MDVYLISDAGLERHPVEELKRLLEIDGVLVWVDVPVCRTADADVLTDAFGFHEIAVRDCMERNHISKIYTYEDHVFTAVHAPEIGSRGHVHYIELDQFLGHQLSWSPCTDRSTRSSTRRSPTSTPTRCCAASRTGTSPALAVRTVCSIVSAMMRREIDLVAQLAAESGRLEQQVMLDQDQDEDTEGFLEELFKVWIRTAGHPHHGHAQRRELRRRGANRSDS